MKKEQKHISCAATAIQYQQVWPAEIFQRRSTTNTRNENENKKKKKKERTKIKKEKKREERRKTEHNYNRGERYHHITDKK